MEKHTQFILGLLGTNWLTSIFNQLLSFCAVLGITHRTNISWAQLRTIALLQLSACLINMDSAWNWINCKYRARSSTGTNCLSFLQLPGGKSMCLRLGEHPTASTQRHRERGDPLPVTEKGRKGSSTLIAASAPLFTAQPDSGRPGGKPWLRVSIDLQPLAGQER